MDEQAISKSTFFKNSTVLKGLEKLLPTMDDSDKKNKVLALIGVELKNATYFHGAFENDFYETLDEKIEKIENYFPTSEEIFFGQEVFRKLSTSKRYELELIPDRRRISRYRRHEASNLAPLLKKNE